MALRIVPDKTIHIPAEKCHAGLVVKTDEQGIETTYAVKLFIIRCRKTTAFRRWI